MATPYTKINISFLGKISDSYLLTLSADDFNALLLNLLNSSIPKFKKCKTDLSLRNNIEFEEDLSDEEIELLANLMVAEWLRPQINNLELIKHSLGSKDFQMFSQSAHLRELQNLRKQTQIEISKLLVDYSYNNNKLDDLHN